MIVKDLASIVGHLAGYRLQLLDLFDRPMCLSGHHVIVRFRLIGLIDSSDPALELSRDGAVNVSSVESWQLSSDGVVDLSGLELPTDAGQYQYSIEIRDGIVRKQLVGGTWDIKPSGSGLTDRSTKLRDGMMYVQFEVTDGS